ncbi:kinase-like domain-containing protein [Mycena galericulata]|nr:kinase-like domain-containing protein [Mycena galericulata]
MAMAGIHSTDIVVDDTSISTKPNTFFDNWSHPKPLPTPAQIRAINLESKLDSSILVLRQRGNCTVLCFIDRGLVVKYGHISVSEGQTLWILARYCPQVAVPAVYGWCQDEGETFVYMEYLDGRTLRTCLDTFTDEELRYMFIGSPSRGPINDQLWYTRAVAKPFSTVREFNESLTALANRIPGYPDTYLFQNFRAAFPDTVAIRFTHTDLHDANIIISSSTCQVIGIVDWQESGWYPAHWEYAKASYSTMPSTRWHKYVDMLFEESYKEAADALETYEATGLFC